MRGRAPVAGVLLVAAVVALVVAFTTGGSGSNAEAQAGPGVTTPLWSVRRVPQPVVEAVGMMHLQQALDAAAPGNGSCFVVAAGNRTLASRNADTPLTGASTQKLLTAAAALSILGPDTTFETRVVANQDPTDGSVDRVWLVGGGDPVLTTNDYLSFLKSQPESRNDVTTSLEALADAIVAKGVRQIPGGVLGDDSRYDQERYRPALPQEDRDDGQIGPMSALTVNDGFSTWARFSKQGVPNPPNYAASELTDLLRARGVEVGRSGTGTAPQDGREIAKITSPPLRDIVASMLTSSDNLTAELLVKEMGLRAAKEGSTAAGLGVLSAKLKELGVPIADGSLTDGSGLDHADHVTCNELDAALRLIGRPEFAGLDAGLPVAGQTGTLTGEFLGSPIVGKLRAKTGTLTDVTGLAGVVDVGRRLTFAYLDNGDFSRAQGDADHVNIGNIIGRYPDSPPVDALVPSPQ
jgi:serine-type D-Ala-D-Ala carboxypeptidase/endopeptidase (penicillin-binding protein 4)